MAKGLGKFAIGTAGAIATDVAGAEAAKSLGFGEADTAVIGTAASLAATNPLTAAAAAPGYVGGKLIQKGLSASGLGDEMQKMYDRAASYALNTSGAKSQAEVSKAAERISKKSERERRTELGKGFAGSEEAAEFGRKMKDPEFRRQYEKDLKAAQKKEIERQQGGLSFTAGAMEALPDWMGGAIQSGGEAIESGMEAAGKAIYSTSAGKAVLDKAGQFFNWLDK
jgi:hypothetical protein